jgi:hypothetical protein
VNCGLYDDNGLFNSVRTYDVGGVNVDALSKLLSGPADKQQCRKVVMVAHACVDGGQNKNELYNDGGQHEIGLYNNEGLHEP